MIDRVSYFGLKAVVRLQTEAIAFGKSAKRHLSDALMVEEGTLEDILKIAGAVVIILLLVNWARTGVFNTIKTKFTQITK